MELNLNDLSKNINLVKEEVFLFMWNNNMFLSLNEMQKLNSIIKEVELTCQELV